MNDKLKYSQEELEEFRLIILDKLQMAKQALKSYRESLSRGADDEASSFSIKTMEDGADALEKERINQLAVRQQKFIRNLENALIRIKNGTYGICVDTGKLISKKRLRLVPHTMQSIDAKNKK